MRLFLLTVTVLAGSLYAADPELVSLAMPDAQAMAGVNLEQVRLSPFGQFMLAQSAAMQEAGLQKMIENTGFDPRRDLREILVASNGTGIGTQSLILGRGTFDVSKIAAAAQADGETIETYKGVSIIEKSKQEALAFLDSTVAIMGEQTAVRAAIDRKSAPTAIGSALAVQVNQLSTTEDVWFVSVAPLAQLAGNAMAAAGPLAMYSKVQQASGGIKFGASVAITLQTVSQTDQDAAALAAVLKALPGMAQLAGAKGEMAAAAAMLQSLSVTTDGKTTTISLSVPETQIEQMILAGQAKAAQNSQQLQTRPAERSAAGRPAVGAGSQRVHVEREAQRAKLLQHADPVYPPLAKQARISGVVRLNVIIGKEGTVQNITVASGHPLLVPSAMQAVKDWVYEPTLVNGKAVEVATQVEVNFTLEQ